MTFLNLLLKKSDLFKNQSYFCFASFVFRNFLWSCACLLLVVVRFLCMCVDEIRRCLSSWAYVSLWECDCHCVRICVSLWENVCHSECVSYRACIFVCVIFCDCHFLCLSFRVTLCLYLILCVGILCMSYLNIMPFAGR